MKTKTLLKTELTLSEEESQALVKATKVLDSLLDELEDAGADEVTVHSGYGEIFYDKRTLDKVSEILDTLQYMEDACIEQKYDEER